MTRDNKLERREVLYAGNVQGVGFRFRTNSIAANFAVTGYVKNLPDGRVELVAEATPSELDRFLDQVAATMDDCIHKTTVNTLPTNGEFRGFAIRH